MKNRLFLVLAAVVIIFAPLAGQCSDDVEALIREAARLEQSGDGRGALELYVQIRRITSRRSIRDYAGERIRAIHAGNAGQDRSAPAPPSAPAASISLEQTFQEGIAAMAEADFRTAQSHFESMLARNPDLPRVKLELALCHERRGNAGEALALYEDVLASGPPGAVAENIRRRTAAITALPDSAVAAHAKERRWRTTVTGGIVYDSNVNAGPETDSVLIFNLPFVLSEDAKPASDVGYQITASTGTSFHLWDRWALDASVSHFRVDYEEQDRFDYDQLGTSLGLRTGGRDWSFLLPFRYTMTWLGDDPYNQSVAMIPRLQKQLGLQWLSTTTFQASLGTNDQLSARDGGSLFASQGFRFRPATGIGSPPAASTMVTNSLSWTSSPATRPVSPRARSSPSTTDSAFSSSPASASFSMKGTNLSSARPARNRSSSSTSTSATSCLGGGSNWPWATP